MLKHLKINLLFSLFIIFFACNNGKNKNVNDVNDVNNSNIFSHKSDNKDVERILSNTDNGELVPVVGRSVIFYSMDKSEYKSFISRMGNDTKWEFDIIYNTFNRTATNAIPVLQDLKINSKIINDPIVIFLTKNNDTILFDRTNDDYFVGQILFDGIDSVLVEEGLMKTDNLEDLIEKYFNLKNEINISYVAQASDSFRYYKVDSFSYYKPDTVEIINIDTVTE